MMPTYQFDIIDGQQVEKNLAAAFHGWAADFLKATGCTLHVSSGRRSTAVQEAGYEKYLAGKSGGVKWAKPSESSHCDAGPHGPCALDIHDSGSNPGVTRKGTKRWNAAVATGKKWGFQWGGWGVPENEGWHFENHTVRLGVYPTTPQKPPAPAPAPIILEDDMAYPIKVDGKHLFLLAPGSIKHFNSASVADLTMRIVASDDKWISLTKEQALYQLDSFGIPRSAVDLDNGAVFDVSKGVMVSGGWWSWARRADQKISDLAADLGKASAPTGA